MTTLKTIGLVVLTLLIDSCGDSTKRPDLHPKASSNAISVDKSNPRFKAVRSYDEPIENDGSGFALLGFWERKTHSSGDAELLPEQIRIDCLPQPVGSTKIGLCRVYSATFSVVPQEVRVTNMDEADYRAIQSNDEGLAAKDESGYICGDLILSISYRTGAVELSTSPGHLCKKQEGVEVYRFVRGSYIVETTP